MATPESESNMARPMTKAQVLADFKENILPGVDKSAKECGMTRVDSIARREAWNNYTDSLCEDGAITRHQCDTWSNPW